MKNLLFLLAFLPFSLKADLCQSLYDTLDSRSLTQGLAFYELYPQTEEGESALKKVAQILQTASFDNIKNIAPKLVIQWEGSEKKLNKEEIAFIESLAKEFPNRKLKGYTAQSEKEIFDLPSSEIDLGRALLLSQLAGQEDVLEKAQNYSALLDFMALQILASLSDNPTIEEKIEKTNHYIFEEMHFRFPPQSIYAEKIDLFTFLPSVMDNHLGVCLGVTALYLSISQRIGLPLEIITPPGHIFVRYRDSEKLINIETTARGVNHPTEDYLSVHTPTLQERTLKEVIGMTHFNQASVYLHSEQFEKAALTYEKALPFMPEDPLLKELLGYSYVLSGKIEEGKKLLSLIYQLETYDGKQHLAEDYLEGKIDLEGMKAIFMLVDETRKSILAKQKRLAPIVAQYPYFREGLNQLAVTWIQLNRAKEAIPLLKRYHDIDSQNPVIEYYLAVLHAERHDFKSAWHYFKNAEKITLKKNFSPKVLKELKRELLKCCPQS